MSTVAKAEQHAQEMAVFSARAEIGVQVTREWLHARQAEVNKSWLSAEGADLLRMQGEAKFIARAIKLIEQGPSIKTIEDK